MIEFHNAERRSKKVLDTCYPMMANEGTWGGAGFLMIPANAGGVFSEVGIT